ncbi:hypothetical protein BHE74_00014940, partial [Ensete ventricosum]
WRCCAPLAAFVLPGGYRCPRAAPLGRAGAVPVGGSSMGTTPLRASCGRCPYGLAAGKCSPLLVRRGRALHLRPGRGRAPSLAGWPLATAFAGSPSRS